MRLKIDFKIGIKILVLFLLLGLSTAWITYHAFERIRTMNEFTASLEGNWMPSVRYVSELNTLTSDYRIAQSHHILALSPAEMRVYEERMQKIDREIVNNATLYQPLIVLDKEKELWAAFSGKWKTYLETAEKILELSRKNMNLQARNLMWGENDALFDNLSSDLRNLVQVNLNEATKIKETSRLESQASLVLLAVLFTVFIGISIIASVYIIRRINNKLKLVTWESKTE